MGTATGLLEVWVVSGRRSHCTRRFDLGAPVMDIAVAPGLHSSVDVLLGHTGAPVVEVPLLPTDVHDLESLDHLGRYLFP